MKRMQKETTAKTGPPAATAKKKNAPRPAKVFNGTYKKEDLGGKHIVESNLAKRKEQDATGRKPKANPTNRKLSAWDRFLNKKLAAAKAANPYPNWSKVRRAARVEFAALNKAHKVGPKTVLRCVIGGKEVPPVSPPAAIISTISGPARKRRRSSRRAAMQEEDE